MTTSFVFATVSSLYSIINFYFKEHFVMKTSSSANFRPKQLLVENARKGIQNAGILVMGNGKRISFFPPKNAFRCHEDSTTGAAGCGYGPPSLPFYHKDYNLLPYRGKICVTISRYVDWVKEIIFRAYRGAGKPRKHCICSSNMCNAFHAKSFYGISRSHDGIVRSRSLA